jgi:hypothetical protein
MLAWLRPDLAGTPHDARLLPARLQNFEQLFILRGLHGL